MVKTIELQDGKEIFVDDEDYERVKQHHWTIRYAHNYREITTNHSNVRLHNFILPGSTQKVKNNDFTKNNLSQTKSHRWSRPRVNSNSMYKGVTFSKQKNKWFARIKVDGRQKHLGSFGREEDAAMAYNKGVDDYWDGDGLKNEIGVDKREVISKPYKDKLQTRNKNKLGYRGINKSNGTYVSVISVNKNIFTLHYSQNLEELALTYNKCALYIHGDRAILNDVTMTDELQGFIDDWEIPEKIQRTKVELSEVE